MVDEAIEQLIEDVGTCFESALGRIDKLRRELREELDGQRSVLAELQNSLDRSLARQTASIDQSFAEFSELERRLAG